jgi:steroid delta-isomerase-like uncharacterized protein
MANQQNNPQSNQPGKQQSKSQGNGQGKQQGHSPQEYAQGKSAQEYQSKSKGNQEHVQGKSTGSGQFITLVKRLFDEVFSKGNLKVADEIVAENVKVNDPASSHFRGGLSEFKQIEAKYDKAFPHKTCKIDDIFAIDDKVVVRWTAQGTHKGDFQGVSPTNSNFKISGISIYRFSNGKIVEIYQEWDRLGLLEQIGEVQPVAALHQ